jgi:hypothetical protein
VLLWLRLTASKHGICHVGSWQLCSTCCIMLHTSPLVQLIEVCCLLTSCAPQQMKRATCTSPSVHTVCAPSHTLLFVSVNVILYTFTTAQVDPLH